MADTEDVRVPSPLETVRAWLGPPCGYQLTRTLIVRLLGVVYVFAFLGILLQGLPLLGEHGLTPVGTLVERLHADHLSFWDVPSVFMLDASDAALTTWAWIGLVIAVPVALGYANMPMLLVLWAIYGSYERVGQQWWGFGWEIQILETTLVAAFLAHPWDPRPLAARPPPLAAIVVMRWLVFRIMLGAGLIKLRGDACWHDLTCLDAHFETQPIPNPLSPWFHHVPHGVHAAGVVFNHVVEIVAPWFVFGPRRLRLVAGCAMAAFQGVLILSGNLSFLNWLTLVPILACFDDDFVLAIMPRHARAWLRARLAAPAPRDGRQLAAAIAVFGWLYLMRHFVDGPGEALALTGTVYGVYRVVRWAIRPGARVDGHQLAVGCFAALVAFKSVPVIDNLTSKHQAMNRSFDRLELVNTYGAFGSVGLVRTELVIEGTEDPDPTRAEWRAYELPCKPGDVDRRPCVLGPYHRRLDWLIWFAAMESPDETAWAPPPEEGRPDRRSGSAVWVLHVVWKLLDGDRGIRELIAVDPFDGRPPRWIRIRRFVYRFASSGPAWWERSNEEEWLPPVDLQTTWVKELLGYFNWPSPSLRD